MFSCKIQLKKGFLLGETCYIRHLELNSIWVLALMELNLVSLIRSLWIAATLPMLVACLPFSWLRPFHATVLGFAERGKIMKSSHKITVPQKFFCHFYALAVIWTTVLLVSTWMYAYSLTPGLSKSFVYSTITSQLTGGSHFFSSHKSPPTPRDQWLMVWQSVFSLLLMEIQVLRRLYETFYVFNYSPSARMNIFGYLSGLYFYTVAPLSLCCNCMAETCKFTANLAAEFAVKGERQMPAIDFNLWELFNPLTKLGWNQWIGAAIFLWGWIHQRQCHMILGSLRQHRDHKEDYMIPQGDWFEVVSSPHYLAEIVIYAGLVTANGGDLSVWLMFAFVVANLGIAAAETHRWYHQKFDNYPPNRRTIIPFIY